MAKKTVNNVKLGVFVLSGLVFLVVLLYFIGSNRDLFGSTFVLKSRFENVYGLVPGNNVRFAGLNAGTVKKVEILNDTLIEVTMIIKTKLKDYIRNNAVATITTDGLVGNRMVTITPSKETAPLVQEGDLLASRYAVNTDEMLETLFNTNNDVAVIVTELKKTIQRINGSNSFWDILDEKSLPQNLRQSLINIRNASERTDKLVQDLQQLVDEAANGKGMLGTLVKDTSIAGELEEAIGMLKQAGENVEALTVTLNNMAAGINNDIEGGKGPVHALLKDTTLVSKLNNSLENIEKGTDAFNENMEALKHNFLFRGYFRKLERQKEKEQKKQKKDGGY